jgi:Flp pilus assembly pilin Flp
MSSSNRSRRGASLVEYAVILVAVLLLAGGAWKLLGGALGKRSNVAGDTVSGSAGGSSGSGSGSGSSSSGGGKGGGKGSGGSGGGSGGEKASAAAKVAVGGVGGAAGESGGTTARASAQDTAEGGSNHRDSGGTDVAEGFTAKRWFGVGLLAAGVLALGYVVSSMRRAKKAADDMGKEKDGTAPRRPA